MSARGRDFQRALGVGLAAHVAEVDVVGRRVREELIRIGDARPGDRMLVVEERRGLREGADRVHGEGLEERGLRGVAGGEEAAVEPRVARAERHRQDPAHGMDRAVQRELPHHEKSRQAIGLDRARRRQEPERDRQVEADALLPQIGRGEVDGDALEREREAGVADGRTHALPALPQRGIRQPHRGECRQPLADVDLHADQRRIDARQACGENPREHHPIRG